MAFSIVKRPFSSTGFSRLVGRYLTAVVAAGKASGDSKRLLSDFDLFSKALSSHGKFRELVCNPTINGQHKLDLLYKAIPQSQLCPLTVRLVELLRQNNRLELLPELADAYRQSGAESDKKLRIALTTAEALPESEVESIKAIISGILGADQDVEVTASVDPSLLAGLKIEMNEKLLDFTGITDLRSVAKSISEP